MFTVTYSICPYFSSDTTFDAYIEMRFDSHHAALDFLANAGFLIEPMYRDEQGDNIVGICPTQLLDGVMNGAYPPSFVKYTKK